MITDVGFLTDAGQPTYTCYLYLPSLFELRNIIAH